MALSETRFSPNQERRGGPSSAVPALAAVAPGRGGLRTDVPVILLGGSENTLSITRNLGRLGIPIYVSGEAGCHAMRSRHCRKAFPVPKARHVADFWAELLLGTEHPCFSGAIVLATCDDSLEFVARYQSELERRYLLQQFLPNLRRAMLDKQATLELARSVGVPTPSFWPVDKDTDIDEICAQIALPVIVKPLNSQAFAQEFGRKLFIIRDSMQEVEEKVRLSQERGHEVMVVEMIPGPDSLLSSYYTFRTATGERLFEYTKSIIRRWPVNRGGACFHQSEWLPETADMGRRLFEGIGWQGIANVEFKRDLRDGKLKIIEVNGRFTAAHRLITEAGAPIDLIVYCHLTGQVPPCFDSYSQSLRMWYPARDFLAFLQLRGRGELSFGEWLRSVLARPFVLPNASITDPWPAVRAFWMTCGQVVSQPARVLRRAIPQDS
ncbi:MAG TPA: hypothetical protein VJQ77_09685 [Novosphingobium sp.]|nr:hypothetical protein [Novosphingobium sp.]